MIEETTKPCALCLLRKPLLRSHFFPKALFKELARGVAADLPAPLLVDLSTTRSIVANSQPTAPLLCEDCESLFDKNGERIVLPQMNVRGAFRLRDFILRDRTHVSARGAKEVLSLDQRAYAYFALSIVWRGSVRRWGGPYDTFYAKLGPYQDKLRLWLRDEAAFPAKVRVEVLIDTSDSATTFGGPNVVQERGLGSMAAYQFLAHGVWFKVYVGGYLNPIGVDAFEGGSLPVAFRKVSFAEEGIDEQALSDFKRTTPVGALATVLAKRENIE